MSHLVTCRNVATCTQYLYRTYTYPYVVTTFGTTFEPYKYRTGVTRDTAVTYRNALSSYPMWHAAGRGGNRTGTCKYLTLYGTV